MDIENNKINCHSRCCRPQDSGISTTFSPLAGEGACVSTGEALNKNSFRVPLRSGFTLLEIVITVIIIAVLATIAVSAYQRATLKSRFNSLMPTTKAIHDGQEAYYMGNGDYADSVGDLDIRTTDTADMSITLGSNTDEDLKYVFATRNPMNNHLIAYQKHSPKFSDHMHCEALKDDTLAQWLCEDALHGQHIDGSVSGAEWDTYVIAGNVGPNDYFAKECEGSGEQSCDCGGPISGTCNDRSGTWTYSEACPKPGSSEPVECGGGRSGMKTPRYVCKDGEYVQEWDESACSVALGLDTSNIQDWELVDFARFIVSIKSKWHDNCGNTLACLQDELDNLCSNNGTGPCLNAMGTRIVGKDGNTYYWDTHQGELALRINDYAARPFFAFVTFNKTKGNGISITGNSGHDANRLAPVCEAVGLTIGSGTWRGCALSNGTL